MKGGGGKKRNGGSEAVAPPNEAASGAVDSLAAPLSENDQNQKGKEGEQVEDPSSSAAAAVVAEEAEEEAEEEEDDEDKVEDDGEPADDDAAAERPKLDDGFYEIQAIRRKRVRKGQLQYLINWRGWPEAANTWEPLENLQSCSDVIDAFEESLRSGKHRKRKRKHGTPHTQPKKKQQHSTTDYDVTDVEISIVSETVKTAPPNKSTITDFCAVPQSAHERDSNGDIKNLETAKQIGVENGCGNMCQQIDNSKDGNEYDPKLSELKTAMFTNDVNMDKLAIHFEEAKASEGDVPVGGVSKADCVEPVQSNRRTGARRRKSGSVKRFKQESCPCEPVVTHNSNTRTRSGGRVQLPGTGNPDFPGENSSSRNGIDGLRNASNITRIVRPMGYSASVSNNVQDVLVTFMAMRSDGTEVVVDNKFLKANDPLLLINFYEQHLRYSPTSSLDRGIDGE